MKRSLLELLVCPACHSSLSTTTDVGDDTEIVDGQLQCSGCRADYPIKRAVPRFVRSENYANSFGFQWHRFNLEQFDFASGTTMSRDRFYGETGCPRIGSRESVSLRLAAELAAS